jgi:hypothetical protein
MSPFTPLTGGAFQVEMYASSEYARKLEKEWESD